jgi:hypothetical protein
MASPAVIAIVCSDRHRNGKTLLARVLVDFLLAEGRDPYCLDLSHPDGALRSFFPGRTALVDFDQMAGQMKVFDTILAGPGRDYVIDIPAEQLGRFCAAVDDLDFRAAAHQAGFRLVVLFVVDNDEDSLKAATQTEDMLQPDLFVPVANRFVGSALPDVRAGLVIAMDRLDPGLAPVIHNRRFSFRNFLLGDDSAVPVLLRASLENFLHRIIAGLREIEPELSVRALRGVDPGLA